MTVHPFLAAMSKLSDDVRDRVKIIRAEDWTEEEKQQLAKSMAEYNKRNPLPRGPININALDRLDPVHINGQRDLDREEADRDDDAHEVSRD